MTLLPLGEAPLGQSRLTAHEFVRHAVRSAILRGSIRGGARLIQADLAAQLGVSTTPVREALRDLATEGLITLDAHRGAVVKQLEYSELVEIQSLTRLLDAEAMRRVAEAGGEDSSLTLAEAHAKEMETETDIGRWVDLNRSFHECLASPLRGTRLFSILEGLRAAAAPYIALALRQQGYELELANQHHRAFVEVIRNRDTEAAQQIAREHVDLTTRTLEAAHDALFTSAPSQS
jgi:DNA-binding GntR family transcriptional regulator